VDAEGRDPTAGAVEDDGAAAALVIEAVPDAMATAIAASRRQRGAAELARQGREEAITSLDRDDWCRA
jgi:hypothetical protein